MTEILSKWKWIEVECTKLGYTKSAKIAHEIEKALKRIYGATMIENIDELKDFQEEAIIGTVDLETIKFLASDSGFCIGCERTSSSCDHCLFGREYGVCDRNHKTLYGNFYATLKEEGRRKNNETK